ncbi:methyl-accepting chemotaxis protein [Halomonas sp. YLGW01]|uniref:methyl-accepting chemotaxis protein n=1 Tax=Halomonas sp. YLGW01 TaxID=2773308 RepID=UPI00177EA560|nr:methyl-accepting chemotaxis protein [Halomonas sp. YLGW01]
MLSSLRLRILAVTLVVVALALIINASVSYLTLETHNEAQIGQQLDAVASGNARAIEEWTRARADMMEATREPVMGDDPLTALIQLAESGGFLSAYIGRPDGSIMTSDGWDAPDDFDSTTRGWYTDAVARDDTIISRPFVDAVSGKQVVSFATPVKRDGRLAGVIGADVVIDDLIAEVAAIRPTPSSFAFLSRGGETLIAHPDAELIQQRLTAVSDSLTPELIARLGHQADAWEPVRIDGDAKRLVVAPVAGTDWELGVVLDEDEATAGLRAVLESAVMTLVIIAAITALLLGLWLKRAFAGLERARDALEDIASGEGDLTRRLPEQGRDEVAQIAAAFNRFIAKMHDVLLDVRDSSESVRIAATEIADGGQDLSRRTENAASSLQQTSASMEEITSTVEHTAESSRQANGLSESASQVARRGGEAVGQVVDTMQGIRDSAAQISEIVTVMDGIAFQTNLLALNASVEAARAGEQGRGFAVVAGEVRKLASRSAEAAKQIKGLIDTSSVRTEEGAAQVRAAGETMEEIVASVTRVTDVLGEITAATGEQSDGIGQVNVAVSELDRMTQQNAALVEESTTAAEQLKGQADRLAEAVAGFTLRERDQGDHRSAMPRLT